MMALARLSAREARGVKGVFFDLDDTILTHGKLTACAYDGLWRLHDAGLLLVGVTGRPIGLATVLTKQWPLRGCVAENGALYAVERQGGLVSVRDECREAERAGRRERLRELVRRVERSVPEAVLASDNEARLSDVAWDIGEAVVLPAPSVERLQEEVLAFGARVFRSSVHMHATFDSSDKAAGAMRFSADELGFSPTAALASFAFVGDSANDAACFGAFRTTFGVSNVRRSLARLTVAPRFVAEAPMGEGFAAIATALIERRGALPA
jgi:HAD superfamily hydrolase (TIGR01484 family)